MRGGGTHLINTTSPQSSFACRVRSRAQPANKQDKFKEAKQYFLYLVYVKRTPFRDEVRHLKLRIWLGHLLFLLHAK